MSDLLAVLLAATFAEQVVAAPREDRVAWVEHDGGARSVWTAAAPGFERRELARFGGDDGMELSELVFSPDGAWLYFVRGGWPSLEGLHPNPASLIQPTRQLIWRVALDGGSPQVVTEGSDPLLDPVRNDLTFQRDGRWMTLASSHIGERAGEPAPLFEARGDISELAWSPAGDAVAFVSARASHNLIGLYRPGEDSIRWIAPDVSLDRRPIWSADGRTMVWLRFPGAERNEFFDFSRNSRFSVWAYDVANGAAREVWRSRGEDGNRNTDLHWIDDGSLLVDSEQDGWRRAYRLSVKEGSLVPLSPSECELFGSAVDARDAAVVVSTNCGDADRRHLARVGGPGSRMHALTGGEAIDVAPVFLASGRYLAYLRSTARRPPSVSVLDLASGRTMSLAASTLGARIEESLVEPVPVSFPSAAGDAALVHGQLFGAMEAEAKSGKRPAVVFLHGGPAWQVTASWYEADAAYYVFNQALAARGYVVLAVNYRASLGYGKQYRTTAGLGGHGALERLDVLGAVRYLKERPDVDAASIGVFGESFGGNVASMMLARHPDAFAAGVSVYGFVDYLQRIEENAAGAGWGIVSEQDLAVAAAASPVSYATQWRAPTLFIHGDDDASVEFSQTVGIVTKLRRQGTPVEVLVLPDESHGFLRHASWLAALRRATEFFDRRLAAHTRSWK
jgi:dipeptidyl aminopeptidase/acylaminoacyl peptidase